MDITYATIAPQKSRALVLVDEEAREDLVDLFRAMPEWECDAAKTFKEARRLLSNRAFDVVLTEYHLAVGNGLHFLCGIRRDGIGIPAIVMSGDEEALVRVPKVLLTVKALLFKPFRGGELKAALQLALRP